MDNTLKELTLALLHNNDIIMDQTEDYNKSRDEGNQALDNMRKIYDGVREKITNNPEALTQADCKFLVLAANITMNSLLRQARTIEATMELYRKLQEIYTKASESPEDLADLQNVTNLLGEEPVPAESEESVTNS